MDPRYFHRYKKSKDGYSHYCKKCTKTKTWHKWYPDSIRCLELMGDCRQCPVKLMPLMEGECRMLETVQYLLQNIGPPEGERPDKKVIKQARSIQAG